MDNHLLISRRKLGQMVFVSAVAGVGSAGGMSLVRAATTQRKSGIELYGITTSPGSRELVLKSLNLKTRKTTTLLSPIPDVSLPPGERVTSFIRMGNSFILATAPVMSGKGAKNPNLIVFSADLNARSAIKPKRLAVPKLNSNQAIDSLVMKQGKLRTLISEPNSRMVKRQIRSYDLSSNQGGEVVSDLQMDPDVAILSQSEDQDLVAVSVEFHGPHNHATSNTLWTVKSRAKSRNFQKVAKLSYRKLDWSAGFRSIVTAPSGRVFALGADAEIDFNDVFEINPKTGEMTLIARFDVMNITL